MEDILQRGERSSSDRGTVRRAGSKVYFNRLLEQNQVPVLWTANTVDEFDPAFLRRMTFAFEMKPLPARARARLWEDFAHRQGLPLPAPQAETLARRHKVSPGLMTGAVQAVAMAGGAPEEIDFVVGALAKPFLRCAPQSRPRRDPSRSELANADVDLARLQAALAAPGAPRDVSLCFSGPPGTGKSAFARQLAGAIGLEALLKRGSDLLSKWIGETERNLARAFEEAREENAFLIIDEAEGFLWNRAGAEKSWEVTMVNELLVQMESSSPALRLHHQSPGPHRFGRRAPLRLQGEVRLPDAGAERGGAIAGSSRSEPPAALGQVEQSHARRLRRGREEAAPAGTARRGGAGYRAPAGAGGGGQEPARDEDRILGVERRLLVEGHLPVLAMPGIAAADQGAVGADRRAWRRIRSR